MKIKIKLFNGQLMPEILQVGDYIDLCANKDIEIKAPYAHTLNGKRDKRTVEFNNTLIPLGIAMKLPKGYSAVIVPRSSLYTKKGVILSNSEGIIDNCFSGSNNQWHFNAIAFRDTIIHKGDRICQFRIELNQFATVWQKIKWLFWNGKIKFVQVDNLDDIDRGDSGSTGEN